MTALEGALGGNLVSCCLYGSAVRGNLVEGVSDINLLLVLKVSEPEAHNAIAKALEEFPRIDLFVLGERGFERSVKSFAAKFSSIRRNYRVLLGVDPLAGIILDSELEKFLCEQALRNLRLRMVYSYVTRSRHKAYGRFLIRSVTPLFLRLSEIVRLDGFEFPADFEERVPVIDRHFGVDGNVLREFLDLKIRTSPLSAEEAQSWHERIFPVVDVAVRWIEDHWPDAGSQSLKS